jgi:hypothetical protein
MILVTVVVVVIAVTILFTLAIRAEDLPPPDPVSPTQYLEDRKAQIYENLRDLQFEYRVGKLSDEDYQQTKLGLQKELAGVLADIEQSGTFSAPPPEKAPGNVCPHCNAKFAKPMKFCGECGKAMSGATS